MKIEWCRLEEGESYCLKDVPKGVVIKAINGVACLGPCEVCGKPVLEGDDYGEDVDGGYACRECVPSHAKGCILSWLAFQQGGSGGEEKDV